MWTGTQELAAADSGSPEDVLKRRCAVMMELSGTLARVLEFCTMKLASQFLAGPSSLNMGRLAETACFVVAHVAAPAGSEAIARILALKLPSSQASQSLKRATLLAPVLGAASLQYRP